MQWESRAKTDRAHQYQIWHLSMGSAKRYFTVWPAEENSLGVEGLARDSSCTAPPLRIG